MQAIGLQTRVPYRPEAARGAVQVLIDKFFPGKGADEKVTDEELEAAGLSQVIL